jgi:hypothetical protein
MSITVTPSTKWDLERFIYSDPALSETERFVALQVLKTLDNKFRPVKSGLLSQALIGYRVHVWRETVNRAVRRLVFLGYFTASWVSVPRATAQGIKGVTRVMHGLGPVLRKLVDKNISSRTVPAGQTHGVTVTHPSPAPPGRPGTVGSEVVAKSTDRRGGPDENSARFKRETLGKWPRLAGRQQPTPIPPRFAELAELERAAIRRGNKLEFGFDSTEFAELVDDEDTAREYAARLAGARRRAAASVALEHRHQPRRRPPRSQR